MTQIDSFETIQNNIHKWCIPKPERDYCVVVHCITYNHEAYISDALEGFVAQKTSFPFCVIVVDDASTDNTASIIREYANKYPEIIIPILLQENQYQQKKKKEPYFEDWFKRAKYIAICEGDDYWTDPLKLQKQVDFLEGHPDYSMICSNGRIQTEGGIDICNKECTSRDLSAEELIIGCPFFICTASIMYKRDIYFIYPHCCKICMVGDRPLKIFCALNGKVFFDSSAMVVYRKFVTTESWSSNNAKSSLTQYLLLQMNIISMEQGLDKWSDYKYTNYFKKAESNRILPTLKKNSDFCKQTLATLSQVVPFYKDYCDMSERIQIFLLLHFPSAYRIAKSIKGRRK